MARVRDLDGKEVWIALDRATAKAMLTNARTTADFTHPDYPAIFPHPQTRERSAPVVRSRQLSYSALDGSEHLAHRSRIRLPFTRRAIEAHVPDFDRIASERLSAYLEGPMPSDVVVGFVVPYVAGAMSAFLNIDVELMNRFIKCSSIILGPSRCPNALQIASRDIGAMVGSVVSDRLSAPGRDPISHLVQNYSHNGKVRLDAVGVFAATLITAGLEVSIRTLSSGIIILSREPEFLQALKLDPARLGEAVEEILRLTSVADTVTGRVSLDDIEIGDRLIPAGSGMVACLAAANRDPSVYPDPDALRFRPRSPGHLSFGHGAHSCLGRHLARSMMTSAIAAILRDCQKIELARNHVVEPWHGVMPGPLCAYVRCTRSSEG